eukprot:TRINITY_DN2668_c0_g1_i2.p2 TRINITY_DN2668_c0_g1~~TRINITY_DN2668_c0_g1_i2.p2  ORF type:complete len:156 (+),score=11.58 TRINITY_DN2668_c0_g1_i2:572-1039(+)
MRPFPYVGTDSVLMLASGCSLASLEHIRSKWWPEALHHTGGAQDTRVLLSIAVVGERDRHLAVGDQRRPLWARGTSTWVWEINDEAHIMTHVNMSCSKCARGATRWRPKARLPYGWYRALFFLSAATRERAHTNCWSFSLPPLLSSARACFWVRV